MERNLGQLEEQSEAEKQDTRKKLNDLEAAR